MKVVDRSVFFAEVRRRVHGGLLPQTAVDAYNCILDEWEARKLTDLRWLAYMLGTTRGEVGTDLAPVREGFAKTNAAAIRAVTALFKSGKIRTNYALPDPVTGHSYYGRGWPQLTHAENYKEMGKILGIPLYEKPDLALEPAITAKILIEGMTTGASLKGDFTRYHCGDFFTATKTDWLGARKIVNGIDRAADFARFAQAYYAALLASVVDRPEPKPIPTTPTAPTTPPKGKVPIGQLIIGAVTAAILAIGAWIFKGN